MPANISLKQFATQAQRSLDEVQQAARILGIPVLNGGQIAAEYGDMLKSAVEFATQQNVTLPAAAQAIAQQHQHSQQQPGANVGNVHRAVSNVTQEMGLNAMADRIKQQEREIVYDLAARNLAEASLVMKGYQVEDPKLQEMLDTSKAILGQVKEVQTNIPFEQMITLTLASVPELREVLPALPTSPQLALQAANPEPTNQPT